MAEAMICAPQPEAVEAGAEVLRQGGNAIDAAIACAFVQGVVDPLMAGIAGFGSMQIYMPGKGVHRFIDFHGKCPAKSTPDMWEKLIVGETRDGFGFILKGQVNDAGYKSITVPLSLKAYAEAVEQYGTWSLSNIVAPAVSYARDGYMVRPAVYGFWMQPDRYGRVTTLDRLKQTPASRKLFLRDDGLPKDIGDVIVNPDLARTLERIGSEGPDVFFKGDIARAIAADMERHGGLIAYDDLANARTTPAEPLWGSYRGYRIATNQPPGGGIMLVQMLNILENFDLKALGHNSPDYIRVLAEAMKRATVDKDAHVGDPAFVDVPVKRLTDKSYAAQCAEAIRRGEKVGVPRMAGTAESQHTTHISVVDRDGNCVSMTHSLGSSSGVVTDGLGFQYNNCMGVFDPRPGRTGSIAPGKSRFSSMCPTIVFKDDRPFLVIGAPGGTQIAMGVLQGILNAVDFGMDMQAAIFAPRVSATSDAIDIANRITRRTQDALEGMGYQVIRSPLSYTFAWVHGIRIEDGRMDGGADPATDGMALAV
ncbi:MAG: gamma-glutamyltransferase [Reyranellaceae bacterium]